jgi:hypothetical protein
MQSYNSKFFSIKVSFFYYTAPVLILMLCLSSCHTNTNDIKKKAVELQIIAGRDEGKGRESVYRMKVPVNWIRHDPLPTDDLIDTTKALCEFIIMENSEKIRIAIHNFPSMQITDRIPPEAQIARWQRQFDVLDKMQSSTIPQSFSGFSGLLFFGEGIMQGKEVAMLGWSLQLAPEHYRNLQQASSPKISTLYTQMRSDITIKAVGPKMLMHKHKQDITESARSFELIREIPSRT